METSYTKNFLVHLAKDHSFCKHIQDLWRSESICKALHIRSIYACSTFTGEFCTLVLALPELTHGKQLDLMLFSAKLHPTITTVLGEERQLPPGYSVCSLFCLWPLFDGLPVIITHIFQPCWDGWRWGYYTELIREAHYPKYLNSQLSVSDCYSHFWHLQVDRSTFVHAKFIRLLLDRTLSSSY